MFTDRFIKVPIKVYNKAEKELTGHESTRDSYAKINPFGIEEYRPNFDDDDSMKCTTVIMRTGNEFTVYLTIKEFENLLNTFNKENDAIT